MGFFNCRLSFRFCDMPAPSVAPEGEECSPGNGGYDPNKPEREDLGGTVEEEDEIRYSQVHFEVK